MLESKEGCELSSGEKENQQQKFWYKPEAWPRESLMPLSQRKSIFCQQWVFRYYYIPSHWFLTGGSSLCSCKDKRPRPTLLVAKSRLLQKDVVPVFASMWKAEALSPHPLLKANSSPDSCRNHVSQGFRANVHVQPFINYHVALSNDELS